MRVLGISNLGNHIVELRGAEYNALVELVTALEGRPVNPFHPDCEYVQDGDIGPAIVAIRMHTVMLDKLNDLKDITERLEEWLKTPTELK